MVDPPRRYLFHPLERRGLLLGLQGGQIAVLVAGAITALAAGRAVPGAAGPGLAVGILASAAGLALWPKEGRPLAGWAPIVLYWLARRAAGPRLAASPLSGRPSVGAAVARARPPLRVAEPVAPPGIDLVEVPQVVGLPPLGVIHDRRAGTWGAVLPAEGVAFPLLDADEQVRRLDGWRAVLGTFARAGTPLRRVQWVQRSEPAPAPGPVVRSYQAWLVVCVGDGRRVSRPATRAGGAWCGGGPGPRWIDQLGREVRLLDGQLRNAGLRAGDPLDLEGLRRLIGRAHQPDLARSTATSSRPWPLASDEAWAALRAGGTWHATYWISEWPRVEVNPDFLTPLLLGQARRTVAVVMAPVPPDRALREVRAARTADVADEELRSRAGFLPSARRHREADGVARREAELADGHSEYRFSGYVTVTADDRESLDAVCIETEQAAQSAGMQLLRLYGRQAEAYSWTLPLGRGLA